MSRNEGTQLPPRVTAWGRVGVGIRSKLNAARLPAATARRRTRAERRDSVHAGLDCLVLCPHDDAGRSVHVDAVELCRSAEPRDMICCPRGPRFVFGLDRHAPEKRCRARDAAAVAVPEPQASLKPRSPAGRRHDQGTVAARIARKIREEEEKEALQSQSLSTKARRNSRRGGHAGRGR